MLRKGQKIIEIRKTYLYLKIENTGQFVCALWFKN